MIKLLSWDSDFFGFTAAQIALEDALSVGAEGISLALKEKQVKLLYLFHNLSTPLNGTKKEDFLNTIGAYPVDTKIVFTKDLSISPTMDMPENISE